VGRHARADSRQLAPLDELRKIGGESESDDEGADHNRSAREPVSPAGASDEAERDRSAAKGNGTARNSSGTATTAKAL
jgi:hypothetical protein